MATMVIGSPLTSLCMPGSVRKGDIPHHHKRITLARCVFGFNNQGLSADSGAAKTPIIGSNRV